MLSFINKPTRYLFFTGKGGVGKTSLASATAVALANQGKKVLLISTDPASNLGQVFETVIEDKVVAIAAVENLFAINIDPEKASDAYRNRAVAPMLGLLPDAEINKVKEQLSGACTTEIASFDEFTQFLADPKWKNEYEHIIFDTAPTGHTLRLLALPSAWSKFIDTNPDGSSCLGPASALKSQQQQYTKALEVLNDSTQTSLILVSRPEKSALAEAARTSHELQESGIQNQMLLLNGVFTSYSINDETANAIAASCNKAIATMPGALKKLPVEQIPLKGFNMVGIEALHKLLNGTDTFQEENTIDTTHQLPEQPSLEILINELANQGKGLIMIMGKGGVGKTTLAAAIAEGLAEKGHKVHLSTTDPAAHLDLTLKGQIDNITIDKIDPKAEIKKYIDYVMTSKGKDMDEAGQKLLYEDLQSPCTEEVAVFNAFSGLVREAARQFVVLDTAPTGHTLLLLDQTGAYHKEVKRNSAIGKITTPFMRLQDPQYSKMIIVTLAENTPVLEAAKLQTDLRRAGIEPYGWIINKTFCNTGTTDPVLKQRINAELKQIEQVEKTHAKKYFVVPFTPNELVGVKNLQVLIHGGTEIV